MQPASPPSYSLRLVGKISLWFALLALLGLLLVLVLTEASGSSYLDRLQRLSSAQEQLNVAMLAGGLVLAVGTGLTTWMITLYSTFRVAGPLYRFSRSLEAGVQHGKVPEIRIRGGDKLQAESQLLQHSVSRLYTHYRRIDALALATLNAAKAGDQAQAAVHLAELREQQEQLVYAPESR